MNDSSENPLNDLLSSFALGPAWARNPSEKSPKPNYRDDKAFRKPSKDSNRNQDYRQKSFAHNRPQSAMREEAPPASGIRIKICPSVESLILISKEIQQVARVYSLYDVAETILAKRERCNAIVEANEKRPALFSCTVEPALFETKEQAMQHIWQAEWRGDWIIEESIEVDPPTGNYHQVARCGLSGEWLGPSNFHDYQSNVRRLHRERFSHMPLEEFTKQIRTERSEEAVQAWLESMKHQLRWKLKSSTDEAWFTSRSDVEKAFLQHDFDQVFIESKQLTIPCSIPIKNLAPSLFTTLRLASNHAKKHPAILIPDLCKLLEQEHMPVFKRSGKIYTGPARPLGLAADAVLAERPHQIVSWIRENASTAKLEGLWKAILPEGSTAPPADYAADLFWLLQQGHILLYQNDTLALQELRPPIEKKPKKVEKTKTASVSETPSTDDSEIEKVIESENLAGDESETPMPEKTEVSLNEEDPK